MYKKQFIAYTCRRRRATWDTSKTANMIKGDIIQQEMWWWVILPFLWFLLFWYVTHCMSPLTSAQTAVLYI